MIPLVVRSHFSMMRGTAPIRELVRAAKKIGYDRLALTDTDNLYGLWPFINECKREKVRPIIGAELTDSLNGRSAVCLVENAQGYKNLCRLISARHCNESFDLESELISKGGSLIVLTSDARLLAAWHYAGLSVFAAMPRNPGGCPEFVRRVAARLKVPLVAVPGSLFLRPEDYKLHRLLRAIDLNTSLSRLPDCETAPRDAWLAEPAEYAHRFALYPQAIAATHEIVKRCGFSGPDGSVVFPPWEDARVVDGRGRNASAALREDAYKGAKKRYGDPLPGAVTERLEHELKSIESKSFSSYFLVVRDIVVKSKLICGRGSGAASLVAYCLEITNVCPIKHNLYFERFLNPGRKDPPDIDVDFAWDERDEVIDAVLEKFRGRAAMVSNHVTFKPRMAIRETAKVFGIPEGEINRVTKRLPWSLSSYRPDGLLASVKGRPEMRGVRFDDPWPEIFTLAQRIIGAPRHVSVHCGGVVITPNPINEYAPLERAPKGVPIIQWEKEGTEQSGLVKIDLLGNRSLGVIRDAVSNVRGNGREFDDFHWEPEEDPATRQSVAKGKTMGCFYIESPAMRLLQERSRRGDFEHLVIHSSIIRPAANDYIREYLRRLHGGEWEPLHPLLKEVLNETYGIMVYQEDVSRVAVALAGFSHEGADILRKILSKKDRERSLAVLRERFFKGAAQNGVNEENISEIWNMIMSFDGYSFCKPHSASYAKVSFQAAYLKTHYPAEFMAAVISNRGGFYSAFAYVSEARRMDCAVLVPDVNESDIRWQGRGREIRVGLMSVKGLSGETMERIVGERSSARFKSFGDFLDRVRPHVDEARSLVHAGACGSIAGDNSRAELLWKLHSHKQSTTADTAEGAKGRNCPIKRVPLPRENHASSRDRHYINCLPAQRASASASLASFAVTPPVLPPDDETTLLRREFSALGFLCGIHPITLFKDAIERHGVVKVKDLRRYVGKRVRVAGWLVTGKVVSTKKGEPMEFLTFEDETGLVETTFFPRTYARFCHMLNREQPYILEGLLEEDFGAITLTVDSVKQVAPEKGNPAKRNKSIHGFKRLSAQLP
ncbi:MAG: DNA polymerase III subunit alpha [Nitrospinota bacterium]